MVFCAYCGKSFTRKEHLERHIPSHTNVKPHRCSSCQLSFARRDLLQRHHSTYHEARDPMEPLPGGVPTVAGRTPIACQNCANAKTGCDKRVPCTRCAEKNLPCAARFARRSSKAAVRAAQANVAFQQSMMPVATSAQSTSVLPFMDVDPMLSKQNTSPIQILNGSPLDIVDPSMTENPLQTISSAHPHPCSGDFSSSPDGVEGFDEIMQLDGTDFLAPTSQYHDMMGWPEYPMGLDLYSNQIPFDPDLAASGFADLSDVASVSDPITSASSRASTSHTRSTSIASVGDYEVNMKPPDSGNAHSGDDVSMPEFKAVIEAEKYWNFARCNSYRGTCPRTAIVHLECLERKSKEEGAWSSLEKYIDAMDWDISETEGVSPMTTRARDRMLAITQSFLLKALDIHRGDLNGCPQASNSGRHDFSFIVLPSLKILEHLLRSHVRNLSNDYPSVVFGRIDPDEMLTNSKASTLLILLMIAQGASSLPVAEARYLSAGLIETCRISLFDMIEKDIELSGDPVVLHCALLFTNLGAWSGDKALMDIAMGQRGMYLSMLKHAGMLEPQPSMIPTVSGNSSSDELQWREWRHRELQNRLVANFVICDQELSLFYDSPPMLSITELFCPLPSPEALWESGSASECYERVRETYGRTGGRHANTELFQTSTLTPSLHDLFQDFLHDNLSRHRPSLSPQQLRLLLHPLQSLLCHLSQMLSCFSDVFSVRRPSAQEITRASTQLRLEEAQGLLERWHGLAATYAKAHPSCKSTICNLILYHLISLNAVTNFPAIERLARRDGFDGSSWELSLRHKRCVRNREEALFRCGQIAHLMRSLSANRRPAWWSAAVYRATLILWADSVARQDPSFQVVQNRDNESQQQLQQLPSPSNAPSSPSTPQGPQRAIVPVAMSNAPTQQQQQQQQQIRDFERGMVALDQVTPEDPALISFLWSGENGAVPVLTRRDGSCVGLDKPTEVLEYGIALLEEGTRCRVSNGIKRKLMALGNVWGAFPGST